MSVNLPRSGHPMVTVNRTVLCSRLSLTVVWLVAKNIAVDRILTHSPVQNVFKCNTHVHCAAHCNASVM